MNEPREARHNLGLGLGAASLERVNESPESSASSSDLAPPTAATAVDEPIDSTTSDDLDADDQANSDGNTTEDDAVAIDLDAIERDLTDVQAALDRLNEGSYWTDEVTGEPIGDDVLAAHPTARTATPTLS